MYHVYVYNHIIYRCTINVKCLSCECMFCVNCPWAWRFKQHGRHCLELTKKSRPSEIRIHPTWDFVCLVSPRRVLSAAESLTGVADAWVETFGIWFPQDVLPQNCVKVDFLAISRSTAAVVSSSAFSIMAAEATNGEMLIHRWIELNHCNGSTECYLMLFAANWQNHSDGSYCKCTLTTF